MQVCVERNFERDYSTNKTYEKILLKESLKRICNTHMQKLAKAEIKRNHFGKQLYLLSNNIIIIGSSTN
jgi:hypothetical protein